MSKLGQVCKEWGYKAGFECPSAQTSWHGMTLDISSFHSKSDVSINAKLMLTPLTDTEKNHQKTWLHPFNLQGFERKAVRDIVGGFSRNSIDQNWISIEAN